MIFFHRHKPDLFKVKVYPEDESQTIYECKKCHKDIYQDEKGKFRLYSKKEPVSGHPEYLWHRKQEE